MPRQPRIQVATCLGLGRRPGRRANRHASIAHELLMMAACALAMAGCGFRDERVTLELQGRWHEPGVYELTAEFPVLPTEHGAVFIPKRGGLEYARIGRRVLFEGEAPAWPQFTIHREEYGSPLVVRYRSWYAIGNGSIDAGESSQLTRDVIAEDLGGLCAGFLLIVIGIFAGLASLHRRRTEVLLFAAFAITAGVRHATEAWAFLGLWGADRFHHQLLHDTSVLGLTAALTGFVARLFPPRATRLQRLILYGSLGSIALMIPLDLLHLLPSPPVRMAGMLLVALMCGWILYELIPLARGGVRHARTLLLGFGTQIVLSVPDIVAGTGAIDIPLVGWMGDLVLTGALGLAIGQTYWEKHTELARATLALEDKVQALETTNREVASLNTELRHQIAERSKELPRILGEAELAEAGRPSLYPGALLGRRYRVVRPLGTGAMGAVYEVVRITDGIHLALKVLTLVRSHAQALRFAREAEIAARISHPNLVSIFDVGIDGSGTPYMVMELVEGGSLERCLDEIVEPSRVLEALHGIALALCELHRAGVVHRDLKPANVLLMHSGARRVVKLADFGIARWTHHAETGGDGAGTERHEKLTKTDAFLGTPAYMAPEQATGAAQVGPAADVFSFGVMAFEMLVGKYPFAVPSVFRALAGVAPEAPVEGFSSVKHLDRSLASLLERCLDGTPGNRPTSEDLARAIGAARGLVDGEPGELGQGAAAQQE